MTVIFGGTGSLGKAIVKHIYGKVSNIHIVSRCEIRQAEMRELYPNCTYHLGDVTNPHSLPYIKNPGSVFNLAASKHVERAEESHEFGVNVNYNGAINTYSWAFEHNAESFSQSNTDKAVEPINAYGMAKGLAVKYLESRITNFPISIYTWSNVMGSRGSVLPKFINTLKKEKAIYLTDPSMTRFWVYLPDVAAFMWENRMKQGHHIPPMKAASILDLGLATAEVLGIRSKDVLIKRIAVRAGEKKHESIMPGVTSEFYEKYTHEELLELVGKAVNDLR